MKEKIELVRGMYADVSIEVDNFPSLDMDMAEFPLFDSWAPC